MLGRNMCLGMKVEGELEPGDEPYEACVILTPSKERGTPHEYDHEHIKNLPLLEVRDAVIVPGDFGAGLELPDAGDLVQTPEGHVLTVSRSQDYGRGGVESINLASGRILNAKAAAGLYSVGPSVSRSRTSQRSRPRVLSG